VIVIIEGLDRCGKSTLVKNLRKHYFKNPHLLVHHSSSPPKDVDDPSAWEIEHYFSVFNTASLLTHDYNYDVIFDRFHLGAAVYGKKYRNANPKDVYELDHDMLSENDDVVLILLTDNPEEIFARDDGGSLESSIEDYEDTLEAFREAFNASSCPRKLIINITENGGFSNTYPTVKNFLDQIKG
jgi:thymidylate kinase